MRVQFIVSGKIPDSIKRIFGSYEKLENVV